MRTFLSLVTGDVRDRVRRPVYLVTLLATIGLGYVAVPGAGTHWTVVDVAGYRGVYNSAYVGTVTALASALWLTIAGFYVVRTTIGRDRSTGVGELLAASPLRTWRYLLAKFASNVAVLASMLLGVAITAGVMQFARGESSHLDLVALLTPYLVLALPLTAVTAAAAVVFEATPGLRSGLGNIVWFFVAMVVGIGGQSAGAPLGGLGVAPVAESFRATLRERHADVRGSDFSLGFTYLDHPPRTFDWSGWTPTGGLLASRALLVVLAALLAAAPALWFDRFDPSRTARRRKNRRPTTVTFPLAPSTAPAFGSALGTAPAPAPAPALGTAPAPAPAPAFGPAPAPGATPAPTFGSALGGASAPGFAPAPGAPSAPVPAPVLAPVAGLPPVRMGWGAWRLVVGELRILTGGLRWWWWGVAIVISAVAFAVPAERASGVLLAAWVWPVLVWSRLGTQAHAVGLEGLLASYPRVAGRFVAQWAAGVLLTGAVAAGPAARMLAAGDAAGVAGWAAGALFVPSLAYALGTVSRVGRPFQALYLTLWYLVVNSVSAVDFAGATRSHGDAAGPGPLVVTAAALALLAAAALVTAARTRPRALHRPARKPPPTTR
ncbi:ABC transporter permease [Actinomadura atramentaria]|uniref:ABC transporter permease n=1 Tax=Actinomadura atramentaria TaxID=1990 RepID=UPI00037A5075|nr:ABC transporter permease [Actinomadura atramentaria]